MARGAVEELIRSKVGGGFAVAFDLVNVGLFAVPVYGNDGERTSVLVINSGSVDVRVGWDADVPDARSIPLAAEGGFLSLDWEEDFVLPIYALFARAAAAGGTLLTLEVRRVSAPDG